MGTVASVIVGSASIYTGTADAYATTAVGYTTEGVAFEYTADITDIEVNEETVAINRAITKEVIKMTLSFNEATLSNYNLAVIGADDDTPKTIKIGGKAVNTLSMAIEGTAPGGTSGVRIIDVPKMSAVGTVGTSYKKGEKNMIPAEFECLKPLVGDVCLIQDLWDITIASGTFAHADTKGGYRVAGEGDAADVLTDISGGSHGDEIILRIADAANAITVTHGAATIVLTGAVDFVMDSRRDWLHLKYITDKWVEQARFDASA